MNALDKKIKDLKNEVASKQGWDKTKNLEADEALKSLLEVCNKAVVIKLLKMAKGAK